MLRNKNVYIILFAVSIVGLFVIQYQYLRVGLNLAKVQFAQKMAETSEVIVEDLSSENQLTFLLHQSLTKDDSYFKLNVDSIQDASRHFIDDFIRSRLVTNGIERDYTFSIYTRDSAFYLESPRKLDRNSSVANYPIELQGYLPEALDQNLYLELQFRDLNSYFLSQLNGMTIPSIIFIVIIIWCIVWIMRSYLSQRNLITSTNEFINNFTHELKTPVFSIGLATKILEEDVPEEKKPVFDVIRKQTDRLKTHIDKILNLSKIESGKELFIFSEFDFEPTLRQLCEDFGQLCRLENATFSFELEKGPYPVNGVSGHLENAVLNVLDNAKKYAEPAVIHLEAIKNKSQLWIKITDNGPGILEENRERIFQKHVRITPESNRNVAGYGLGLSYVNETMKKHRGKVEIKSELNKGTEVTLKLPLRNG